MSSSTATTPAERHAEAEVKNLIHRAEDYIREKPSRAAVQAALFGYTLHFIPIRTLLSAAARLAIPGLFAAGLYKVVESCRECGPAKK